MSFSELSGIGNSSGVSGITGGQGGPNNNQLASTVNQLSHGIAARGAGLVEAQNRAIERDVPLNLDVLTPQEIIETAVLRLPLLGAVQRVPQLLERWRTWLKNDAFSLPTRAEKARLWLDTIEKETQELKRAEFESLVRECEEQDSPEALLRIIQSAEPTRNLFLKAKAMHPHLSLIFLDGINRDDFDTAESEGISGTIRIRQDLPVREKIAHLTMELANLCDSASFFAIDQKVYTGEIDDAETYAEANERVEYEACKLASKTLQACITTAGWDPETDHHGRGINLDTFEEYYAAQQDSGHTDYYRKAFDKINRNAQDFQQRVSSGGDLAQLTPPEVVTQALLLPEISDGERAFLRNETVNFQFRVLFAATILPRVINEASHQALHEDISGEALPQEPDSAQEEVVRRDALSKDSQDVASATDVSVHTRESIAPAASPNLQMSRSDLATLRMQVQKGVQGQLLAAFIEQAYYVPSMSTVLTECYDNLVVARVNDNGQEKLQHCTLRRMFEQNEEGEWTLQAIQLLFDDSELFSPSFGEAITGEAVPQEPEPVTIVVKGAAKGSGARTEAPMSRSSVSFD